MAKRDIKPDIITIEGTSATLNDLKLFTSLPFFIPWYHSPESKQAFPIFINEIGDLNANRRFFPGVIERNPFFDHTEIRYFVAMEEGVPIGRLAAFVDHRYNYEQLVKHNNPTKAGWVGLFECIDDDSVARQLFEAAHCYLQGKDCQQIIGPAKFNANGPVGLLVKGFEQDPFFMEPYNPDYYPGFFENLGFEKLDDWFTVRSGDSDLEKITEFMGKARRIESRLRQSDSPKGELFRAASLRTADFGELEREVEVLDKNYNGEWGKGNHPQFVTMTTPELRKLANDIKLVDRPEYVLVVELGGKPIGISASVPNINEKIRKWDEQHPDYRPSLRFGSAKDLFRDGAIFLDIIQSVKKNDFESLRVLILGVEEQYRQSGIDARLYRTTFETAIANGIKRSSLSQLAERNPDIVNPLTQMGSNCITCRVYSKSI